MVKKRQQLTTTLSAKLNVCENDTGAKKVKRKQAALLPKVTP